MNYVAYDGNLWRVERLKKATKIVSQIVGLNTDQLEALIWEVEDSRGALLVKWKHRHTSTLHQAFMTAWEICKEDPNKVFSTIGLNDFLIGEGE